MIPRHERALTISCPPRTGGEQRRRFAAEREGEPGFVKRCEGFEAVLARAETFSGTDHAKIMILAAVRSLRGLTPAERQVLAEAVDIVPREDFASPAAGVLYARNRVFAERCGLAIETVKAARRGLERKGFAVRHIAGDNNGSRFDIRPFLADVDRYIEERIALDQARHEDDERGAMYETIEIEEDNPGGVDPSPHIQSPITSRNPVPPAQDAGDTASASTADKQMMEADASRSHSVGRRQAAGSGSTPPIPHGPSAREAGNCSPMGARGTFGRQTGSIEPAQARQALLEAYQASPRWRALVSVQDIDQLAYDRLFAATAALISEHFPDRQRNHDQTWAWAVERHGWRAIIMAIVSLEDPAVRQPGRYFGWLALKADGIDLAKNLAWLPKHIAGQGRDQADDDVAAELTIAAPADRAATSLEEGDGASGAAAGAPLAERWPHFLGELRRRAAIHDAGFTTWLAPLQYVDFCDGCLELSAPSEVAARWVRERHEHHVKGAAATLGWRVRIVRIHVRS